MTDKPRVAAAGFAYTSVVSDFLRVLKHGVEADIDDFVRFARATPIDEALPDHETVEDFIALGMARRAAGDGLGAIEAFLYAWRSGWPELEAAHHVGVQLLSQGDPGTATKLFAWLVQKDPALIDGIFYLGISRAALGDQTGAQSCFERVVEAEPGHAGGWLHLGASLLAQQAPGPALAAFDRLLMLDPTGMMAPIYRSVALRSLGQLGESIAELEALLARVPKALDAYLHLAHTYLELGDKAAAINVARRGVAHSDEPRLKALLGNILVIAEQWQEAFEVLSEAAHTDPAPSVALVADYARAALKSGYPYPGEWGVLLAETAQRNPRDESLNRLYLACHMRDTVETAFLALTERRPHEIDAVLLAEIRAMPREDIQFIFKSGQRTRTVKFGETDAMSLRRPVVNNYALMNICAAMPDCNIRDRDVGRVSQDRKLIANQMQFPTLFDLHHKMLATAELVLPSPFGGMLRSRSSVILDYEPSRRSLGSCTAYFFEDDPAIAIFATEHSWPVAWYDPISDVIFEHGSLIAFSAMLKDLVLTLKAVCVANFDAFNNYLSKEVVRPRQVVCQIGSVEFISTHIFADLSGLEQLIEVGEALERVLVTAQEVYGPIEALFPELAETRLTRPDDVDVYELNQAMWNENVFTVRVTGRGVTAKLADRVVRYAEQQADATWTATLEAFSMAAWPILFVALRTHNRRWTASHQEIAAIFNAIRQRYPKLAIIIDGHGATSEPVPAPLLRAEQEFAAGVRLWLDADIPILETAGRPLGDSVYAATFAHCHLSAQGTTTTKPVLIANKPGVVIGSQGFAWDVRPFRQGVARCETPWAFANDLNPNDIYTNYDLSPTLVLNLLLDIIAGLDVNGMASEQPNI